MLNTSPPPPPHERDTPTLVEDLCIALRDVGVHDAELPDGPRVLDAIERVGTIHRELTRRRVDLAMPLRELSTQTHWRMEDLLEDCLAFPHAMPYVREEDGVRRTLRCGLCRKGERPPDDKVFWLCDGCLRRAIDSIDRREPAKDLLLFRTYNPESRCAHADADTVLAATGWYDFVFGNCRRCFEEELNRRPPGSAHGT